MRALITNDDGIDSPGLRALAQAAVDAGLEVTVAAPELGQQRRQRLAHLGRARRALPIERRVLEACRRARLRGRGRARLHRARRRHRGLRRRRPTSCSRA